MGKRQLINVSPEAHGDALIVCAGLRGHRLLCVYVHVCVSVRVREKKQ